PGEEAETEVGRPQRSHRIEDPFRAEDPIRRRLVAAGGTGGMEMNPRELPHAIRRHIDPTRKLLPRHQWLAESFFQTSRHARARFASADDSDAADFGELQL